MALMYNTYSLPITHVHSLSHTLPITHAYSLPITHAYSLPITHAYPLPIAHILATGGVGDLPARGVFEFLQHPGARDGDLQKRRHGPHSGVVYVHSTQDESKTLARTRPDR